MRSLGAFGALLSLLLAVPAVSLAASPAPGQLAADSQSPRLAVLDPSLEVTDPPRISVTQIADVHSDGVQRLWIGSICAMLAASALDAVSSWNKQEANPLLASSNGSFGARGLSIKAGIAGAVILPQLLLRKHREFRKMFIIANFADAAVFTGASIHNLHISSQ